MNYPFANSPVTLIDGSIIADPANTPAQLNQCLPYQCGADPDNSGARQWCAAWGLSNALVGCVDTDCAPWRAQIPGCALPIQPPSRPVVALTPPLAVEVTIPSMQVLTPQNIVQPLPDITAATSPVVMCSQWDIINGWIAQNPLLAVAILAGVAALAWPKRRRA